MADTASEPRLLDPRRRRILCAMGIDYWVRRDLAAAPRAVADAWQPPRHHATTPAVAPGWDQLQQAVSSCTRCELSRSRRNTVFGSGDQHARVMVIGEAPGEEEDRQGVPFVGRAGGLLNQMLLAAGLSRETVYIANILKCRPPGNRNPSPQEAQACHDYLQQQVRLLQPEVILSVGGVSATNLLQTDQSVGSLRGRIHRYGESGIPMVVTYHPSYLLRRPAEKAKTWDDLQLLMAQLR
jgi:uracil-DNA glycosylase